MLEPFWGFSELLVVPFINSDGTDGSIGVGGGGIIQDFRDTDGATGPDSYQFIGDTELKGADLCNT